MGSVGAGARIRPVLAHSNAVLKNVLGEAENLLGRLKLARPRCLLVGLLTWGSRKSAWQIETSRIVLFTIAFNVLGEAENLLGRLKHGGD